MFQSGTRLRLAASLDTVSNDAVRLSRTPLLYVQNRLVHEPINHRSPRRFYRPHSFQDSEVDIVDPGNNASAVASPPSHSVDLVTMQLAKMRDAFTTSSILVRGRRSGVNRQARDDDI